MLSSGFRALKRTFPVRFSDSQFLDLLLGTRLRDPESPADASMWRHRRCSHRLVRSRTIDLGFLLGARVQNPESPDRDLHLAKSPLSTSGSTLDPRDHQPAWRRSPSGRLTTSGHRSKARCCQPSVLRGGNMLEPQGSQPGHVAHAPRLDDDKRALASGMQGFQISAAKHLNAAISKDRLGPRRRGAVFPDRGRCGC